MLQNKGLNKKMDKTRKQNNS